MILKETMEIFISGGKKENPTQRMQRGLCNDMDKLFETINNEINALPPEKRSVIWNDFLGLLNDRVQKGVYTPPTPKNKENHIINLSEFADEKAFNRTSDETYYLTIDLRRAIVEMKIKYPKDIIHIQLLYSDSNNAKILNALAKNIASDYEDQVVCMVDIG